MTVLAVDARQAGMIANDDTVKVVLWRTVNRRMEFNDAPWSGQSQTELPT